jgi:primosomal replication protein N
MMERGELRYTPAGVPVCEFRVRHASRQVEAGHPRQVEMEIAAVAIGDAARGVAEAEAGSRITLAGFLANRSRRSTQVVLHVNQFEIEQRT